MLLAFFTIHSAPARAAEDNSIRIGKHDEFVRIVIETKNQAKLEYLIGADAKTVTIHGLKFASPPKLPTMPSAVAAITPVSGGRGTAAGMTLVFREPVRQAHQFDLPPDSGHGWRSVVDYAPTGKAAETGAKPAPVPASAEAPAKPDTGVASRIAAVAPPSIAPAAPLGNGSTQLSTGLRSVMFGAGEDDVAQAIEQYFGAAANPVRMGFNDSVTHRQQILIAFTASFPEIGLARAVYKFDPKTRTLSEAVFEWGGAAGNNQSAFDQDRTIEHLLDSMKQAGFRRNGVPAEAPANGDRLVFVGADAAARQVMVWAATVPAADGAAISRPIVRLRLTATSG